MCGHAPMLRSDGVVQVGGAAARTDATAAAEWGAGMVPATQTSQRTRRRAVEATPLEGQTHERTITQLSQNAQLHAVERDHGREEADEGDAMHRFEWNNTNKGCSTASNREDSTPAADSDAERSRNAESGMGARGVKRTWDAADVEDAARRAMHPPRARGLASVQHQQAVLAGWVQSEVATAQELSGAASMAAAAVVAARAVLVSIAAGRNGGPPPVLEARMSALFAAVFKVQTNLDAAAREHVARGYAAMATAREAGAAAEHAVDAAMDDAGQLLTMALTAVANGSVVAVDATDMAMEEPGWLREAAEALGVGSLVATEQAMGLVAAPATPPPATGRRVAATVLLQSMWRAVHARREVRARIATAIATADAAREEQKRAARERLALREEEERAGRKADKARARREAHAVRRREARRRERTARNLASAAHMEEPQQGAAWPVLRLASAVMRLQRAWHRRTQRRSTAAVRVQAAWRRFLVMRAGLLWRSRRNSAKRKARRAQHRAAAIVPVAPAFCSAAPQPYIVPAAPALTRLYSATRRAEAARVVQAVWRRRARWRAARNERWARLVAEADVDMARRYALQEERAAAVQQRVATVRAFRQLEVDLRAQGIRAVGGAASGGRQRARLREQRRREGIAERLWQRTMGM